MSIERGGYSPEQEQKQEKSPEELKLEKKVTKFEAKLDSKIEVAELLEEEERLIMTAQKIIDRFENDPTVAELWRKADKNMSEEELRIANELSSFVFGYWDSFEALQATFFANPKKHKKVLESFDMVMCFIT